MTDTLQTIRRRVAAKVARMTSEQARTALAAIEAEQKAACPMGGATIFHPTIRKLTGGYNSQSLNFAVIRKLADRAQAPVRGGRSK
jgi:hypothetical protein